MRARHLSGACLAWFLVACASGEPEAAPRRGPAVESGESTAAPDPPTREAPRPAPAAPPLADEPAPPALSIAEALGQDRASIERAWGASERAGLFERYADGRLVRYRRDVAVEAQGRVRERGPDAPAVAEWLGVPDAVMAECRRNLEAWCGAQHQGVSVERRANVYRLFPIPEGSR